MRPVCPRLGALLAALLLVSTLGLSACANETGSLGSNERHVTAVEFGTNWPLTVSEGTLRCSGPGAVTFESGGTVYAVNGTAEGLDMGADIEPIWAYETDPLAGGPKKNIGALIEAGLALCGEE